MQEETPQLKNDCAMYRLLREGQINEFNARRAKGESFDLRGTDLRGLDLRGLDTESLDLSNCYFRQSDLRGLNLTTCNIEGASFRGANVSGTFFPDDLSPEEIRLSLDHGTRVRYCTK